MRPVVFIHGLFGSGSDWGPIISELSDFNCIKPDLPGHGDNKSTLPHYSLSALAEWLYKKLSLNEPADFIGYSLGGRILLALNQVHPEMFKSLTLISVSPGLKSEKERAQRVVQDSHWSALWSTVPREQFFQEWYSQELFLDLKDNPSLFKKVIADRSERTQESCGSFLRDTSPAQNPSMWPDLKAISRGLWIVGGNDKKYVELGQSVVAENPRIGLKILSNASHGVHLQKPSEVSEVLRDYIGKELTK